MSVFRSETVRCVCGAALVVQLADSVNAAARPQLRDEILAGTLHRVACPACGRRVTVETSFLYSDLPHNLLIMVMPRGERRHEAVATRAVEEASAAVPESVSVDGPRAAAVVFGIDALRETLIARHAGLDGAAVDLLKVAVVRQHPTLPRQAPLRLSLQSADAHEVVFDAREEDGARAFSVGIPRSAAAVEGAGPEVPAVLRDRRHFWTRLWPWARTPTAEWRLRDYAAKVAAGRWVNFDTPEFAAMLSGLPRGAQLSPTGKRNLRALMVHAKARGIQKVQDDLFEIRFGFALDDNWWRNDDPDDIDALWRTLDALPDAHVAGNGWIREIDLDPDGDGKLAGSYRQSEREISIASTELAHPESLQLTIRHEVGHAVHASKDRLITDWLEKRFGWRTFALDDEGIDGWVLLAGGWDGLWEDDRRVVRSVLREEAGPGSRWGPRRLPDLAATHPWHRAGFGPRLAVEQTGSDWYLHHTDWYRCGGKALFVNYWYASLMAVDPATLDIVERMPRRFAAMSPKEFFAELYALYYDHGDRRREDLPRDVAAWMAANIGPAVRT